MSSNPQLDNSFAVSRRGGMSDEQIRIEALKGGWNKGEIDAAFASIPPIVSVPPTAAAAPTPAPVPAPALAPAPQPAFAEQPVVREKKKFPVLIIVIILAVLLVAFGAYAFVAKTGLFGGATYKEDNLMSGLLVKFSEIKSSSYKVSAALYVAPRDADAEPFVAKAIDKGLKEKYYRDSIRGEDVQGILSSLRYPSPGSKYPSSISTLGNKGYYNFSTADPLTEETYSYQVTDNGNNFALSVTFETSNAISTIRSQDKYSFGVDGDKIPLDIKGNTVTFTKDSYSYMYLPVEPPKAFLEAVQEYVQFLDPKTDIRGSVGASVERNEEGKESEWKFNLDGTGDFGDLTYKVNVDALKAEKDYYVRINNIPSLFGGYLPPKGQWIKFTPEASSTDDWDGISRSFISSEGIAEIEDEYKIRKEGTVDFLKKLTTFADEEKLFAFKSTPHKEKVDGRSLYRYDLRVRKEAVLPFYKKLIEEASKNDEISSSMPLVDEGYLNYLESPAFSDTFDYYDKNINVTLWTDEDGYPAQVKYSIRIVPADDAVSLKGKQVMLDFTLSLDDINKPISIEAPEGAKTYEEAMKGSDDPLSSARLKGKSAAIKSNLSSLRAQAEIVWDENGSGGYGTKAFTLGPCKKTEGTLFGDEQVYKLISSATDSDPSKATCISGIDNGTVGLYAVSAPLPDREGYSYCIDSTGTAKEILGSVKGLVCR